MSKKSTTTPKSATNAKVAKAKPAKKPAAPTKADKPMSSLDAAARVLTEAKTPMNAQAMVEAMIAKGYWKTGGKTPQATIYAAIIREIAAKGAKARFKKTARGMFALA